MSRHWVDITAVGFFIIEWLVYAATLEHSAYGRDSLSARMNRYREVWVRRLLDRETRMVDMQIMASLQNGTAFFASTSLFALGGALALLHATNDAITILGKLPIDLSISPAMWELKCVGLVLICVYAFFKFAWAYRLFNYVAILLRRHAAGCAPRHAGGRNPCHPHLARVRIRRPPLQPRPARLLLRARLSRLVRQPLGAVRDHGRRGDRDLATPVCVQCMGGDGAGCGGW